MPRSIATVTLDPFRDPQVGDCLRREGASLAKNLYRIVVGRSSNQVQYMTGPTSVVRLVWLSSWQEWSANADIEYQPVDVEALAAGDRSSLQAFFSELSSRDRKSARCVVD